MGAAMFETLDGEGCVKMAVAWTDLRWLQCRESRSARAACEGGGPRVEVCMHMAESLLGCPRCARRILLSRPPLYIQVPRAYVSDCMLLCTHAQS